jgi:hypothetical protein
MFDIFGLYKLGGCIFHQPGPDLGSLFATEKGHLIVTGGNGISKSVEGKPVMDYVNNDTWYDDTSDGPVKAVVVRSDGSRYRVELNFFSNLRNCLRL